MARNFVKTLSLRVDCARPFLAKLVERRFSHCAPLSTPAASEFNTSLDPINEHYDPARAFLNKDVQKILYRVTGFDSHRLADRKNMTDILELPVHRYLTVEEFEIEKTRGFLRAKQKLKIPPVMAPRKPGGDVISADSQLDKLLEHKMIFTDITYGLKDRERAVVVRDVDGTLRNGSWDEKMRMCQTFFPRAGRECFLPRMFLPDFLPRALDHVSATYLLDSACAQLEPDDPDYIRVTHAVYDDVDKKGTYDELYSTRLFGGLVFYLTSVDRLDGLMLDRLKRGKVTDAADVVRLLNILHPKCRCALEVKMRGGERPSERQLLDIYIETMARDKLVDKLRRALDVNEGTDEAKEEVTAVSQ